MSQADVQSLVTLLSNGQADLTLFPKYFFDVMAVIDDQHWHTTAVPITFTQGSPNVTLPANLLDAITIIYDDTVLSRLTLRELEALRSGWRQPIGNPVAYTTEALTSKTIQVFPSPPFTSPAIIPVHGLPVGTDYQPGNGISIHSELRSDPLPYLTLPIALLILAREYVRESPHMDMMMAQSCAALGNLLLEMLR